MDIKSLTAGFLSGLMGKGVLQGKDPVAYLYNGVRLPGLPEWDSEKYPCALLVNNIDLFWTLYCFCDVQFEMSEGTIISKPRPVVRFSDAISFDYRESMHETWVKDDGLCSTSLFLVDHLVWANFNVIDATDNSIYLAASEPIPVYE